MINDSQQWLFWIKVPYNPSVNSYTLDFYNADPRSYYQFRVLAYRVANDKPDPGLPSPVSTSIIPSCGR